MRRRWREPRFLCLLLAGVICVGGALLQGVAPPARARARTGEGRAVDRDALDARLRDGRLVKHEALFYREAAP